MSSNRPSISTWVKRGERDAGKRADGRTSAEREALSRLGREDYPCALLRALTPAIPAARISRAIRLRPTGRPSAFSSA